MDGAERAQGSKIHAHFIVAKRRMRIASILSISELQNALNTKRGAEFPVEPLARRSDSSCHLAQSPTRQHPTQPDDLGAFDMTTGCHFPISLPGSARPRVETCCDAMRMAYQL
jgi:hypothetical protein